MNDLIEKYLQRGFGTMNKNDFEVAIFNELLKEDEYRTKNDYQMSVALKIPASKVKRLRYEATLRYSNKDAYVEQFNKVLLHAQFKEEGGKLKFLIEDKALRLWMDDRLKSVGRFSDYSFNSEIVVIHQSDFAALLRILYFNDTTQIEKVEESVRNRIGEDDEKYKSFVEDLIKEIRKPIRVLETITSLVIGISKYIINLV